MNETVTHESLRGRATKRLLVGLVAAPVVLAFVWALANVALRGSAPPPRWTEADLPPLPIESENGWVTLAMRGERIGETKMSASVIAILDAEASEMPARARAARGEIDALLGTPPAVRGLALWADAIGHRRFVDACPLRAESSCAVFVVLGAHRLALLSALRDGLDGRWDASLGAASAAVRADLEAAETSRTLIAARVTSVDLRQSITVLEALLAAHAAAGAPALAPSSRALLSEARTRLGALDPTKLDLRRTIVAEYVFTRHALDDAAAAPTTLLERVGYTVFYDPRATWDRMNERYAALLASVDAHVDPPPPSPERATALWWLRNPVGKIALDGSTVPWGPQIDRTDADRARVVRALPGLRRSIDGALRDAGLVTRPRPERRRSIVSRVTTSSAAISLLLAGATVCCARNADAESREEGLFLRLGVGVSVVHHTTSADAHEVIVDGSVTGTSDTRLSYTQDPGGFVGEIAAGWAFAPGLAIAGLYSVHAYRHAGYGTVSGEVRGVNAQASDDVSLALYGALATYHPNPAGPFHIGLSAGYATLRWDNPFPPHADVTRSSGFALGPEAGLEGYAGEGFWIGATAGVLVGRATKTLGDERHVFFAPSLLLTLVYSGHARGSSGTSWVGEGR